jgi:hypothetical protein
MKTKATAIEALWTLPLSAKTTYKLITMLKEKSMHLAVQTKKTTF